MVPADSQQIPRARCYSGNTIRTTPDVFAYGALTHYGDPFQKSSTNTTHMPSPVRQNQNDNTPQHRTRNPCRVSHEHGLASSAFARHYSRNHGCFLFLWVLRCFTSPRSLYPPYIFRRESLGRASTPSGVSPFGHPRIRARLSAPRGLSQIATSFFGSRCQGIHRLLLET